LNYIATKKYLKFIKDLMQTHIKQILKENNVTQQVLLKAIASIYDRPIRLDRLSVISRGEFDDIRVSTLLQIIAGFKILGIDCTLNDLIKNE